MEPAICLDSSYNSANGWVVHKIQKSSFQRRKVFWQGTPKYV